MYTHIHIHIYTHIYIKIKGWHREEVMRRNMEMVNIAAHDYKILGGHVNQQNEGYKANLLKKIWFYLTKTSLNQKAKHQGLRGKNSSQMNVVQVKSTRCP